MQLIQSNILCIEKRHQLHHYGIQVNSSISQVPRVVARPVLRRDVLGLGVRFQGRGLRQGICDEEPEVGVQPSTLNPKSHTPNPETQHPNPKPWTTKPKP